VGAATPAAVFPAVTAVVEEKAADGEFSLGESGGRAFPPLMNTIARSVPSNVAVKQFTAAIGAGKSASVGCSIGVCQTTSPVTASSANTEGGAEFDAPTDRKS